MSRTEPFNETDVPEVTAEGESPVRSPSPAREKVFRFAPRPDASDPEASPLNERHDWGAAIDLVKEASEAIRFAEERAQAADDYSKQLSSYHKDQLRAAEARIAEAERRAEAANSRANEAEAWLSRFHDAVIEGFGRFAKD